MSDDLATILHVLLDELSTEIDLHYEAEDYPRLASTFERIKPAADALERMGRTLPAAYLHILSNQSKGPPLSGDDAVSARVAEIIGNLLLELAKEIDAAYPEDNDIKELTSVFDAISPGVNLLVTQGYRVPEIAVTLMLRFTNVLIGLGQD